MYPDKATLYAFQNVYEPLPTVDNKWIVFYKDGDSWRQKQFITKDGGFVFYYTKVNEFKAQYQQMFSQRSK